MDGDLAQAEMAQEGPQVYAVTVAVYDFVS